MKRGSSFRGPAVGSSRHRIPVVLQMLLFMTLGNFNNASYSPLSSFIKEHYMLTSAELGLVTSSIFLGATSVSFLTGLLVDRLGPYTALKIAFTIMSFGTGIVFLSSNFPMLIAGYYSVGFGYGIVTPSSNSVTMEEYYPNHAPRMGIKQSGVPLGLMLSAIILTPLVLSTSLRDGFLLMFLLAASLAVILPRDKKRAGRGMMGSGYLKELLSTGKNKSVLALAMGVIFLGWGQQTLLTFFVLYQRSNGISPLLSATLLVILLGGSIFGRMFWASVSDRVFRKNRVRTLSLIMGLTGVLFILFNLSSSYYPLAAVFAFAIGMNAIGWNSAYVTAISEIAPRAKVGLFSGVSLVLAGIGTIVGTPISGKIRDEFSFTQMWLVLGISLAVMSIVFLLIGSKYVVMQDGISQAE